MQTTYQNPNTVSSKSVLSFHILIRNISPAPLEKVKKKKQRTQSPSLATQMLCICKQLPLSAWTSLDSPLKGQKFAGTGVSHVVGSGWKLRQEKTDCRAPLSPSHPKELNVAQCTRSHIFNRVFFFLCLRSRTKERNTESLKFIRRVTRRSYANRVILK